MILFYINLLVLIYLANIIVFFFFNAFHTSKCYKNKFIYIKLLIEFVQALKGQERKKHTIAVDWKNILC